MTLSDREKEFLRCIAQDLDTNAISKKMGIAKGTIGVMKYNIRAKLGKEHQTPNGLYRWAQENQEELKA